MSRHISLSLPVSPLCISPISPRQLAELRGEFEQQRRRMHAEMAAQVRALVEESQRAKRKMVVGGMRNLSGQVDADPNPNPSASP